MNCTSLPGDVHDVVTSIRDQPSHPLRPGFAFSRPITGIIGPRRAAELMHQLMVELFGEVRYIVQGGDWGAAIGSWIAHKFPSACMGLHINMDGGKDSGKKHTDRPAQPRI